MRCRINKFFFWFSVIVLAFLPGGIFVSLFLLVLYYLLKNHKQLDKEKNENTVCTNLHYDMSTYSKETMEEMR